MRSHAGARPGAAVQCVTRVTPPEDSSRTRSPGRKTSSASCVIARISPVAVNTCRLWLAVGAWSLVPGVARHALSQGRDFWLFVTVAGLFGPFLGRLLIMYSLRTLRAAHSALLLLMAPVFAFLIGFFGFGTAPTARELLGGAIMLAGIALPSLAHTGQPERAAP